MKIAKKIFALFFILLFISLSLYYIAKSYEMRQEFSHSIAIMPVDDMLSLYSRLEFDDDYYGGRWEQGFKIKYNESQWNQTSPLKVFIVPYSHNEAGWLKTFEDYYQTSTKYIFENMVVKLNETSGRKFIWCETSFLALWWATDASEMEKELFKKLVHSGAIEIVTGGWVMNDEANSHFLSIIQQLTTGHQWLLDNLHYIPNNHWAIDPFGYSSSQPYLLKLAGFENSVIQRVHYRIKKELAVNKELEFRWRQFWDYNGNTEMFTHLMPFQSYDVQHSCGPDPPVCCQFDFFRLRGGDVSCWFENPQKITNRNVHERSLLILDQWRKKAQLFRSNVVLVPLGEHFRYSWDVEWDQQYGNYEALMTYINNNTSNTQVRFGTLEDYFQAVHEEVNLSKFPVLSGDFFTYADSHQAYWSGYYTSRPFYKRMDRVLLGYVRAAEMIVAQLVAESLVDQVLQYQLRDRLEAARRALALFQHHDGITGTSKDAVREDYAKKMHRAINTSQSVIQEAAYYLLKRPKIKQQTQQATIKNQTQEVTIKNDTQEATIKKQTQEATIENQTQKAAIKNQTQEVTIKNETQETTIKKQTQEATMENQTQKAAIGNQTQETAIGNQTQKAAIENQTREATIENQTQKAVIENQTQKTAIENQTQEVVIKNQNEDAMIANQTQKTRLKRQTQEGTIKNETKEAILKNQTQEVTIENKTQETIIENQTQKVTTKDQSGSKATIENQIQKAAIENQTQGATIENQTQKAIIKKETHDVIIENKTKEVTIEDQTQKATLKNLTQETTIENRTEQATIENYYEESEEETTEAPTIEYETQGDIFLDVDDIWRRHDKIPTRITIVLDEMSPSRKIVLYNSLNFRRREILSVFVTSPHIVLFNPDAEPIPAQVSPVVASEKHIGIVANKYQVSFPVDVAVLGLTTYTISLGDSVSVDKYTTFSAVRIYNAEHWSVDLPKVFPFKQASEKLDDDIDFSVWNGTKVLLDKFGLLKGIVTREGRRFPLDIDYVDYYSRSGAYLFYPSYEARIIEFEPNPELVVIEGVHTSAAYVGLRGQPNKLIDVILATTVYNNPYLPQTEVEISNTMLINEDEYDLEVAIRFNSKVRNGNVFYTDLNGMQMIKRRYLEKLPLQANWYPLPAAGYIEDGLARLTLLTSTPLGVAALKPGQIEVMQDRRIASDDGRGLGQGVLDNVRTRHTFRLIVEPAVIPCQRKDRLSGQLTLGAHMSAQTLLHPLVTMHYKAKDEARPGYARFIRNAPDVVLASYRAFVSSMMPDGKLDNGFGLVLQRVDLEVCYGNKEIGLLHPQSEGLVHIDNFIPKLNVSHVYESTLTFGRSLRPVGTNLTLNPQEIKAVFISGGT